MSKDETMSKFQTELLAQLKEESKLMKELIELSKANIESNKANTEISSAARSNPAHWISVDATHSKCEKCEAIFELTSPNAELNFCPNCGADMREVQTDATSD